MTDQAPELLPDEQIEEAIKAFARSRGRSINLTYDSGTYEITKVTGAAMNLARDILALTRPTPAERPVPQVREALIEISDRDWGWTGGGSNVRRRGLCGQIAAKALGIPEALPLGWPDPKTSETKIALAALASERPSDPAATFTNKEWHDALMGTPKARPSDAAVAWTNEAQLGFLRQPHYANNHVPMAMWAKQTKSSDIPLYRAIPHEEAVRAKPVCICDQDHPLFKERGHHPHCPAARALSPTVASERVSVAEFGNSIEPHSYSPDHQMQGDCRVCGHGPNHEIHSASERVSERET